MSNHYVQIEDLRKVFPAEHGKSNPPVFENINFHIDHGELNRYAQADSGFVRES